ncbi:MAG TPA: ATP-binding cassette domain-containing protein [Spirochaetota bacterium]|nr:ATP-binding cassette domain-containing protein [Spirochaetota bacterium]HPF06886.1 ATP-binding cassette domain-containing protein [Spirochaetota bacterium]HPJ43612.1 ATP-binding cassette domain-containing protein [Spirochaetota bacterium]HPR38672.1 ATP-binding cassette domain-containing protein [Spirochaetota bacterium]HRX48906.1 ATP-binding cassette domain-containing protein [Spirochaetota bacterium]
MITVDGLSKSYGDFKAVDDISFKIRDGEITGLLGPNGAGKTTTLRMLSCYLSPDSGSITVDEKKSADNQLDIKKMIGYLPESAPLYSDMMVYDYLKYVAEIRGITDEGRISEVAGVCRITDVMHKNINELSKGYKQRVGLAHAMIHDPQILILDEPTSGLDPIEIVEIRNLIKELGKKKTVILSTHILSEVEATCDRVIIINRGRIVADDSTENLQSAVKGDKDIIFRVSGTDFSGLKSALSGINGIKNIANIDGDEFTSAVLTVDHQAEVRPEIFKTAVQNNWVIYEMKQEHLSLENVFRELTTGGEDEKAK